MAESDRSRAADKEAKRVALGFAPRASDWEQVVADMHAASEARRAAWVAACDPRVKEVMDRLDALIGARNDGKDAYFADCRPTPEESALWDQLWDLLGEPGVAPVDLSFTFGPTDYVRTALRVHMKYWSPGGSVPYVMIGDRDWGSYVCPRVVPVDLSEHL